MAEELAVLKCWNFYTFLLNFSVLQITTAEAFDVWRNITVDWACLWVVAIVKNGKKAAFVRLYTRKWQKK